MKGFLLGAMALIVIEVAGRRADKIGGGLGVLANGVRRALAPNVAGLRNFTTGGAASPTPPPKVQSSQVHKLLTTAPARVR